MLSTGEASEAGWKETVTVMLTSLLALSALATNPVAVQGQRPVQASSMDSPEAADSAFAPTPLASSRLASNTATQLCGLIHFPNKLNSPGWDAAEDALSKLRTTLGPGAIVRWDGLFHEANWYPHFFIGYGRDHQVLALINKYGLRSLMDIVPHPWYGSGWDNDRDLTPVPVNRPWGKIPANWRPLIAQRYREMILDYRNALAANGMPESENAIQFGNEPAAGHPGGDDSLPRGTWSGHPLWYALNQDPSFYGDLQVIAPAISMADESAARREFATSSVPKQYNWTPRVDHKAMHFRYYNPRALTPEAYAQGYVNELKRRARLVLSLGWPRGNSRQAQISEGLWVTEGYVASGDCPEPRAECWRRVLKKVSQGVPGVLVYTAYRFYPTGGPDGLDWSLPQEAMVSLDSPLSAVPQRIRDGSPLPRTKIGKRLEKSAKSF